MKSNARNAFKTLFIIAVVIGTLMLSGCGGSGASGGNTEKKDQQETVTETAVQAATGEETSEPDIIQIEHIEYDANSDYDKFAMVEYMVEDIGAEFTATVSAKEDDSEFEVHCSLDNVEQVVVLDKDYNIISDKTGNMSYDAPLIVQKAVDENNWQKIGE